MNSTVINKKLNMYLFHDTCIHKTSDIYYYHHDNKLGLLPIKKINQLISKQTN